MMKGLFELAQVSSYQPVADGFSSELLGMVGAGYGRDEALGMWVASGRSVDSFRHAYKKLKDRLLKEAFAKKNGLAFIQHKRMECWERFQKVKCLLIADKRVMAMELAGETLRYAQKYGLTEIVLSLSAQLEFYFGAINPDTRRYLRYRKIRKDAAREVSLEQDARGLYTCLIFYARLDKDWESLRPEVEKLEKSMASSVRFIVLRCNVLVAWYELLGDIKKMVAVVKDSIQMINKTADDSPHAALVNRYLQLLPILTAQKKFAEAESYLSESLGLPDEGSYTWHQLMLQKAYLGFHSGKPKMALAAWQQASKHKKHSTPLIDERWYIVRAYLAIYEKLGHLAVDGKPFRLARFLNSVRFASTEKQLDNVAILIVQMLHYLLDGKKKDYMHRADNVSNYMAHNLRGKEHIRCRCMLYMLKKVEEGDYYRLRSELRAKKWRRLLGKNPPTMSSEREILPYEMIWKLVLGQLK
ncbi:MAG TPA: hypothetical protein ENJ95_04655 [Bacteroidetes bacterium]|nr:hypothetical protein [Bacteroidota bacterium]